MVMPNPRVGHLPPHPRRPYCSGSILIRRCPSVRPQAGHGFSETIVGFSMSNWAFDRNSSPQEQPTVASDRFSQGFTFTSQATTTSTGRFILFPQVFILRVRQVGGLFLRRGGLP